MSNKSHTVKNADELAEYLGLDQADAREMELKLELNNQIIEIVKKMKLTHEKVAKLAGSSRTRMTALLNRNTHDISIELMLRVLSSLGYKATLKIKKAA
jgi:predicted XRE-type DNA-binding protein